MWGLGAVALAAAGQGGVEVFPKFRALGLEGFGV